MRHIGIIRLTIIYGTLVFTTFACHHRQPLAVIAHLQDGTELQGTLRHYRGSHFELQAADGRPIRIAQQQLSRLEILPADGAASSTASRSEDKQPDPAVFATPEATFATWKRALLDGDLETMASCFVDDAQPLMLDKLKAMGAEERKRMVQHAKQTTFSIEESDINAERARLVVFRTFKKLKEIDTLLLLKQAGQWKLMPQ